MSKKSKSFQPLLFVILFALLILFFLMDIFIGSVHISPLKIMTTLFNKTTDSNITLILYNFRIPKALTAIIAGSALSVSGLQMQTVFRNPLAGPYVLGISAGATLGVAMFMLGFSSFAGATGLSLFSNIGIILAAWGGLPLYYSSF